MNRKYALIPISIFILCTLIFSFSFFPGIENKANINWSDRTINWEDFELVDEIEDDYVAAIYSNISLPNLITESDSKVYAYMNPNFSSRLRDEYDSYNVLVHEQYHFNITEYCARLLRKELVQNSLGGLSIHKLKELRLKYVKKLDSLQNVYDSITDHNAEYELQRFWELKIDNLLRQTAYYENEDVYSYYNFTKDPTRFYKALYFTFDHKVLTSYPVTEEDIQKGESYEIANFDPKEKVIKFYKDGKLTNGGYFETAIVKILKPEKDISEIHYYNADETYNTKRNFYIRKSMVDEEKNRVDHYFNAKGERITRNSIFEMRWQYNPKDESHYTSYFNKKGENIGNPEGIFHEKRKRDEKGRTVYFASFDQKHKAMVDKTNVSKYVVSYNDNHLKDSYKMYGINGDPAYYLSDYHLSYTYDERGNTIQIASLDEKGQPTYDHNGASIYEYTYDLYDRQTSVKRFNADHEPLVANDDYFEQVKEYDSLGRKIFEAFYYPGHVLKFSDDKRGATSYAYEEDNIAKEYNKDAFGFTIANNENVAIIKKHMSPKNLVIEEVYLDTAGYYAKTLDKITSYKYKYDPKNNLIESAAYDSIGNLVPFEADVAMVRWQYDANGNKIKTAYYNKENKLAYANDSVTFNLYKYNNSNTLIEQSNFDINMKPALFKGTFKTRSVLNSKEQDSIQFVYDENEKLKKGVSITKYFYNNYGNRTRIEYYDTNWKRIKNEEGVSAKETIYNKRQYIIGYKYYDEYNRLTNTKNGVAIEKWKVDALGHTIAYEYFNKNSRPIIGPDGYHKLLVEWSPVGEISKTSGYDQYNKLIEDPYGVAIYEYEILPSGLYAELKRYNKEGKLTEDADGIAITTYTPSLNGLYFAEENLNAQRESVNDTIID